MGWANNGGPDAWSHVGASVSLIVELLMDDCLEVRDKVAFCKLPPSGSS